MKRISLIIMVAVLFGSCTNKAEKARMLSKITKMESQFTQSLNNQKIDPALARELADEYIKFSNDYTSDTNSPRMLYKAGIMNLKYIADQKKAIDLFIRLKERYPKFSETPMALYTAAYIYNDVLKDTEKAKECYELLIKDYPDHYLTKEAKVLVQFVGKSDEQLLNAIIGKKVDSTKPLDEKE
jgi:tetratricopeptide (TPR) repeat protein